MGNFVGSSTTGKKLIQVSGMSKHNKRELNEDNLLEDKIKIFNSSLLENEKYLFTIDYENLEETFKIENYNETFEDPFKHIQKVKDFHKENNKYINLERQNMVVEQIVWLSNEQVQNVFKEYGIEEGRNKIIERFKKISKDMEIDYGLKPLEMSIHFDEGKVSKEYDKDKNLISAKPELNIHCHFTYGNYDFDYRNTKNFKDKHGNIREVETKGKTILRNFRVQDMRNHQDLVYRNFKDLGFQRGVSKKLSNSDRTNSNELEESRIRELNISSKEKIKLLEEQEIKNNIEINIEDMEYNKEHLTHIQNDKNEIIKDIIEIKDNSKYDEVNELQRKIDELTPYIENLEIRIEHLKNSKKDITSLNISNEQKKELHKKVQSEMKELRTLRNVYKEDVKTMKKEHELLIKTLPELREQSKQLNKENNTLNKNIKSIKSIDRKSKKETNLKYSKFINKLMDDSSGFFSFDKDKFVNEMVKYINIQNMSKIELKDIEIKDNLISSLKDTIKQTEKTFNEEIKSIHKKHNEEVKTLKNTMETTSNKYERKTNSLKEQHEKDIEESLKRIKELEEKSLEELLKRIKEKSTEEEEKKKLEEEVKTLKNTIRTKESDYNLLNIKYETIKELDNDKFMKIELINNDNPNYINDLEKKEKQRLIKEREEQRQKEKEEENDYGHYQ